MDISSTWVPRMACGLIRCYLSRAGEPEAAILLLNSIIMVSIVTIVSIKNY